MRHSRRRYSAPLSFDVRGLEGNVAFPDTGSSRDQDVLAGAEGVNEDRCRVDGFMFPSFPGGLGWSACPLFL